MIITWWDNPIEPECFFDVGSGMQDQQSLGNQFLLKLGAKQASVFFQMSLEDI